MIDDYIESASPAAQPHLRELRELVRSIASDATERLSYGMPTYDLNGGRLVQFSAAKHHVGVYALVHVDHDVPDDLREYVASRSTLQFRFDRPLPVPALEAAIRRKVERLRQTEA